MATRKSVHYSYNPRYDVDHFDLSTVSKNNIVKTKAISVIPFADLLIFVITSFVEG